MTKQEQINELRDLIMVGSRLDINSATAFAETLYQRGYRKQGEWISVDERLPERQCELLAYYHFDNENDSKGEARFSDRSFVSVLTYFKHDAKPHFQHESTGLRVTHWMPLPEPPRMKGGAE